MAEQHLDRKTYEASKLYLREALKHMAEAGHKVRDLSAFALERFGDEFKPYLEQFYRDVREERISLNELSQAMKTAFFGQHVSPAERERRVRETAYLLAEQRGFAANSDFDDWLEAERLVDEQLARQAGLVAQGRKRISSVTVAAEKELAGIKRTVAEWVEKQRKPAKKSASRSQTAAKAKSTGKTTPARKAASRPKAAPPGKSAVKKKAVKKQAVKKSPVKKKSAKKKSAVKKK